MSTDRHYPPPRTSAILALCLVSASHAYSLSAFFAFAGFLSVDLGWATDLDHSGVAVGILGAVLPASRIPVSVLWGVAMDKFGRRPCLVLTCSCLSVGSVLFPLMRDWSLAVLIRFVLLGMGNGWVVQMAVCCAELGGPKRQAKILGYVIGAGGFINLVGPGLGGLTYHAFGSAFPALLPCLLGALLSLVAALWVWLCFPETRPPSPPVESLVGPATPTTREVCAAERAPEAPPPTAPPAATDITLATALRAYPLPLLVALRCLLGFLGFAMLTLIPLWGIASTESGGLALDHEWLGLLLSASAALTLVYSTLGMAKVIELCGVRGAMIASSALQCVMITALPCSRGAPFALLVVLNAILQGANTTCFTCTIAAVNNVCSRFPHKRGAINGVNVTVESTAKSFGPSLGGSLFAWAISQQPLLPPGMPNASIIYFSCISLLHLVFFCGALRLPMSIDVTAKPDAPIKQQLASSKLGGEVDSAREAAASPNANEPELADGGSVKKRGRRGSGRVRWTLRSGNRSFRRLQPFPEA